MIRYQFSQQLPMRITTALSVSGESRHCELSIDSNEVWGVRRLVTVWCTRSCRETVLFQSTKGDAAFRSSSRVGNLGAYQVWGGWWQRMVKWRFKGTCSHWSASVKMVWFISWWPQGNISVVWCRFDIHTWEIKAFLPCTCFVTSQYSISQLLLNGAPAVCAGKTGLSLDFPEGIWSCLLGWVLLLSFMVKKLATDSKIGMDLPWYEKIG